MSNAQYIQSIVCADGNLELRLAQGEMPVPGRDEVLIRVDAAPINPSDLGTLLASADVSKAYNEERAGQRVLRAPIPAQQLAGLQARLDRPQSVGNEGAGLVIGAGESPVAQALLGRTVAVLAGGMFAQYRCVAAAACLPLPDAVTARAGASCFVNPLTALGMVETMKLEGHRALVHTAAASNLGQMLQRLCLSDGIALVNIVRSAAQTACLRALGARHVCNSSDSDFVDQLTDAVAETHATLTFDAIAGGRLASSILTAMERAAARDASPADRYGSTVHKQVYLYGALDNSATILDRTYGMAWGVGGWLMPNFLARIGAQRSAALRERVAREITTTFASDYTAELSLAEALDADTVRRYQRKATGEKYLISPHKDN